MKLQVVKPEDYGLQAEKASELTVGLKSIKDERELLIAEFETLSKLELIPENLPKFKKLRLQIRDNRTKGIEKWHKSNKEFFLTGGRFVDAIKNKESQVNEAMETKLLDAEKHFENLEKNRLAEVQSERVRLLREYVSDASERDLSSMDDDVWSSYLKTKKEAFLKEKQEKEDAEKERLAKIEAERIEQERIRKENEKLKAEAEEKERIAKKEAEAREKAEKERQAKEEAEFKKREEAREKAEAEAEAKLKAEREAREKAEAEAEAKLKAEREAREKAEAEAREAAEKLEAEEKAKREAKEKAEREAAEKLESELSKGDEEKVKDLIADLEALKTKYSFKSKKNQDSYTEVGSSIDRIVLILK